MKTGIAKKALLFLVSFLLVASFPVARADSAQPVLYGKGLNGYVCLTIDDGFSPVYIKQALDLFRAKKVKCTFFVIGSRLKASPDLWRQAVKDGHEICYHSMTHRIMSSWSNAAIVKDLNAWNALAKSVLGANYSIPKFARLPGGSGHKTPRIQKQFASLGYKLIGWSADTYTGVIRLGTKNLKSRITAYIKSRAKPNAILLTHFNGLDVPSMSGYINWLKSHCKLGTISDAFRPPAPPPTLKPTPKPTPEPTVPSKTFKPTSVPTGRPTKPATEEPTATASPEPIETASGEG